MKRILLGAVLLAAALHTSRACAGPFDGAWSVPTGQIGMNMPVYGDVDPLVPGNEVIVAIAYITVPQISVRTLIYAMHADGSVMDGWGPKRVDAGGAHTRPALGDHDGDGAQELVLVVNEFSSVMQAQVLVFESDGSMASGDWPVEIDDAVACSPVLADLDQDGRREVLVACRNGKLYVWRHDGTSFGPGAWPLDVGGELLCSPAVGTLERGAGAMIVIGSDQLIMPGRVHVLHADGTPASGWPQQVVDRDVLEPSIADIDQDGDGEIVIGGGTGVLAAGHIYAFESDGSLVAGSWPVEIWDPADPHSLPRGEPRFVSIADLDVAYPGLEIVTAPIYRRQVYAFHADGTAVPGWPVLGRSGCSIGNAVLIGDIDGRPGMEVVVGEGAEDEGGRLLYMLHADGSDVAGTPVDLGGWMQASAAMGDIDGDGRIEIVQPVAADGSIRCIEVDSPGVRPESLIWPMQQHDACRTSFLDDFPRVYAVGDPPDWLGGADHAGSLPEPRIWSNTSADAMTLRLFVSGPGTLSLAVFDLRGRMVATPVDDREVPRGETTLRLPGIDALGSGIYFARASVRARRGIAAGNSKFVVIR